MKLPAIDQTGDTFFGMPPDGLGDRPVALLGVPFDALSTERRGSSEAPGALRRASHSVGQYSASDDRTYDRRADLGVDLGDLRLNRFDPTAACAPIHDAASAIHHARTIPILIGGDHSLTYPAFSAAAEHHSHLRLVQIDAHFDATDPAQWRCAYNHGTFVRNLIVDRRLAGQDVFQVGLRDYQWRDSGAKFLAEQGACRFSMDRLEREGPDAFVALLADKPDQPTYLTFDIDSVDPAFAPGTGEHMVGGLTAAQALAIVRRLFEASINIVAADLVEVVPALDPTGRTVALAANVLGRMVDGLTAPASR
jgi:agmatinase